MSTELGPATRQHAGALAALQPPDDGTVWGGAGEHGAHKDTCPPQAVPDDLAAAQVLDLEAQVTIALVGLKQRVVCVQAKVLSQKKDTAASQQSHDGHTWEVFTGLQKQHSLQSNPHAGKRSCYLYEAFIQCDIHLREQGHSVPGANGC